MIAIDCSPKQGEPYKCVNCMRFCHERDSCFTEWMKKYGFVQQKDCCPGYHPPENGKIILMGVILKPNEFAA